MMRITFSGAGNSLTEAQVATVERDLGLTFPRPLRDYFLRTNGGYPDLCVYEDEGDEEIGVVVQHCLPLTKERVAADSTYRSLVAAKGLVPKHFFPFALDPGGDVLFVDCSTEDGQVVLWHHDTAFDPLVPIKVGLDEFWSRLKPDE